MCTRLVPLPCESNQGTNSKLSVENPRHNGARIAQDIEMMHLRRLQVAPGAWYEVPAKHATSMPTGVVYTG